MQKQRYGYWIGNVNARKDLSVTDYLVWEVVKRAKSEGFKKLDLGPSDLRLFRYKTKFDPVLELLYDVEKRDTLGKITDFAYNKLSAARARLRS
jgi:hypothetical protein